MRDLAIISAEDAGDFSQTQINQSINLENNVLNKNYPVAGKGLSSGEIGSKGEL